MRNQTVPAPWERLETVVLKQTASLQDLQRDTKAENYKPQNLRANLTGNMPLEWMFENGQSNNCYALLDAGQSLFLRDRLQTSGLKHACLYDLKSNDNLGDTAPWLVALEPQSALTMGTLSFDPEKSDPGNMFGVGIWLVSSLSMEELRAHLRRYIQLPDEIGVRQFFRLQEPGMLDVLLNLSAVDVRQKFFAGVQQVIYPWPTLQAHTWNLIAISQAKMAQNAPSTMANAIAIDRRMRRGLACYINDRTARLLATSAIANQTDRSFACDTFFRLLTAGYDHESRLVEAFQILQRCPTEAHPHFWREVESGQHSLRRILLVFAKHYQIQDVLEGSWE